MPYTNVLEIGHRGKGIPYGGHGEVRPDGGANYGFKNLKGAPHLLSEIPELHEDPALHELVEAINGPETGLFSVGCVSGRVDEARGHRVSGYVEIALNSDVMVADATNYFPVFFHFERLLHSSGFDRDAHFHWKLTGATFFDARVDGFTAAITINTGFHETAAEATETWATALDLLTTYLGSIPIRPGQPLY